MDLILLSLLLAGVPSGLLILFLLWSQSRTNTHLETEPPITQARTQELHRPRDPVRSIPPIPGKPLVNQGTLDHVQVKALLEKIPHVMLVGATNAGKTTMAQALCVDRADQLSIIDPDTEPGKWGGLPVITTTEDDSYAPIEQALQGILREMKRRAGMAKSGDTGFPPLTIVWDEVPDTIEECPSAGIILRRLSRRSRKYKIRLILLTQSERVQALGIKGHGDVLLNFARIRLRKDTYEDKVRYTAEIIQEGTAPIPMETDWVLPQSKRGIDQGRLWTMKEEEEDED